MNKIIYFVMILNIPLEQDQTPRPGLAQTGPFLGGQRQPGKPRDEGARRHRRGLACVARKGQGEAPTLAQCCTTQSPPACFRLEQSCTAASRLANGPTMAR